MVCRDTGNPAREGKRRVVGCQFSPGPEKHFMGRVFCSVKGIQKIAAKAENATIVRLVDVVELFVEGRLGFHWGLHAVPSWYTGGQEKNCTQTWKRIGDRKSRDFRSPILLTY